jgi:hypothetical protein
MSLNVPFLTSYIFKYLYKRRAWETDRIYLDVCLSRTCCSVLVLTVANLCSIVATVLAAGSGVFSNFGHTSRIIVV